MPLHDEEMNRRREKREAMRKKQQEEQKRLKIALIAAAVVLVCCGVGIYLIARNASTLPGTQQSTAATEAQVQETETQPPTEETKASSKRSSTKTIHIKAAGDLNITNSVVEAGLSATGYDYTEAFLDVASILADADLTVLNFEGNVCGEPYGTETTSAPREILTALRNAGVDMLQIANSCSVNNGLIGLSSTLQAIRNAGLEPLGAYASTAEFNASKGYTICEVDGIKIAFVAFTKGVGGLGMPAGNEKCVNLLYTDYATTYSEIDKEGINKILDNVASEKPDITVAMLHWGSEYNDVVSDSQTSIVSLMKKKGVDIIIGTHPHTVQKIDFDQSAGTLVAYSLGDFFGNASRGGTNYSIILDVEITKDADAGTTKVTGFSYTPIYTLTSEEGHDSYSKVVRIEEAMLARDNNYVDKVTDTAYEAMKYALERITVRVTGEEAA